MGASYDTPSCLSAGIPLRRLVDPAAASMATIPLDEVYLLAGDCHSPRRGDRDGFTDIVVIDEKRGVFAFFG